MKQVDKTAKPPLAGSASASFRRRAHPLSSAVALERTS